MAMLLLYRSIFAPTEAMVMEYAPFI